MHHMLYTGPYPGKRGNRVNTKQNWGTLFGANLLILILLGSLFVLACVVVLIAVGSGYITVEGIGHIDGASVGLLVAGMETLYMGAPLLIFLRFGRPDREVLKLSKPRLSEIALSMGMAFGVFGALVFLEMLTAMLFRSQGSSLGGLDISVNTGMQLWIWIPAVAIIPALLEEFVFRGIVLGIYEKHMPPWRAVILSGIAFGLLHMQFSLFYLYIGIGIVLGWVVYRSRSVWVGVAFHLVYNSLAVLLSYFQTAYPFLFDHRLGLAALMGGRMHSAFSTWSMIAAVSAAVFALCLMAFNRRTRGRVVPKADYPRHPFVDWVPLFITLSILGLLGVFSLFAVFILPGIAPSI